MTSDLVPTVVGRGLTGAQVAERIAAGEVNHIEQVTSRPLREIVRSNVLTRFNGLLGALAVLVLATGSFRDALFVLALVFNSVLGIAQEWHAKRKLDSLAVLHAPTAHALRDGSIVEIPTAEVVLGDTLMLRAGDQVPADGQVLASDSLEVDESNLTGESDAVAKDTGDEVSSGTAIVAGSGWFRADVVGQDATSQRLASEARKFTRAHSEIQHSTNVLLRWLTWIVLAMLPIAVWSSWRTVGDQGWRQVVLRAAAGLVGLVPEGLVVLTTLAFLLAAVQLTRKQALVQELPAVEGLARVDVICLDKTGTLTKGEIAYEGLEPLGSVSEQQLREVLGAFVHDPQANQTALAIASAMPDPGTIQVQRRVPFSSARKWSGADLGEHGRWLLGAPDVLLSVPSVVGVDGAALNERVAGMSDEGRRLVLLARTDELPERGQIRQCEPAALVELSEVVRTDASETLAFFAAQGVIVKVISGDTPRTVAAVGRRVGLDVGVPVDARTLPTDLAELAELAEATKVFGRVTPAQKRAIVKALQSKGHVVAMTGDGVNDVLALKDADIGIAMGNAAQATKAVAQLVLLDSKFSHLPDVLAAGRRVIGNVERVASLFVAKNVMSAVAILASAIWGLAFPFLPRQMTLVSTLTIGIPAAILALGPNPRRYLPGFLERVLEIAVPAGLVGGIAGFVVYSRLDGRDSASTAALTALLVVNLWLLSCLARPYLPWKVAVVLAMAGAAGLAYALPIGRDFFHLIVTERAVVAGLVAGGIGAAVVEMAFRISRRRSPTSNQLLLEARQPSTIHEEG